MGSGKINLRVLFIYQRSTFDIHQPGDCSPRSVLTQGSWNPFDFFYTRKYRACFESGSEKVFRVCMQKALALQSMWNCVIIFRVIFGSLIKTRSLSVVFNLSKHKRTNGLKNTSRLTPSRPVFFSNGFENLYIFLFSGTISKSFIASLPPLELSILSRSFFFLPTDFFNNWNVLESIWILMHR